MNWRRMVRVWVVVSFIWISAWALCARFGGDAPFSETEQLAAVAFGVPLAALALGASLAWFVSRIRKPN